MSSRTSSPPLPPRQDFTPKTTKTHFSEYQSAIVSLSSSVNIDLSTEDIFALAPGFIAVLRGPTHIVETANLAFQELVGGHVQFGQTALDGLPEVEQMGVLKTLDTVYATGKPATGRSLRFTPKRSSSDRKPHQFVDVFYQPIKAVDGDTIGILLRGFDVSKHKRTEDRLRRSREELREARDANNAIFENSLDVICTVDESGAFTQVSRRSRDMWGYEPEELIGRGYIELVHADDIERTNAIAAQIISGTPTYAFENRFVRKDGSSVSLLWSSMWSDQRKAMYAVARDLTERKKAEDEVRQAQKMHALGQLTGGIAHDFNNLLTVIINDAEELVQTPSDEAQTAQLSAEILAAANQAAELTRHLLAFARRQPLKPSYLSIREVVEEVAPLLRRVLSADIELQIEMGESALSVMADRALLESAILNLAINARDALAGKGILRITTIARGANEDESPLVLGQDVICITVADNGPGIPPEALAHVFEPFFTTKEKGRGSGLGLSMVYGFARQSGGTARIRTASGEGTKVDIILPAVVTAPSIAKAKKKVLIVEKDQPALALLSARLLSLGFEVTAVPDSSDLVSMLTRGQEPDLLIAEAPTSNELEAGRLERALARRPSVKAILTFPAGETQGFRAASTGVHLLARPYSWGELAARIQLVLGAASPEPNKEPA